MLEGGRNRVKVMGLVIAVASGLCAEGLHATSAQLFGKCPPPVTKPLSPPGSRMRDRGTSSEQLQLHGWWRAWIWGQTDPVLNPISAASLS